MASVLSEMTTVFTWIITQLGALVDVVSKQPLLLIGVILPILGVVIGYFKSLTR